MTDQQWHAEDFARDAVGHGTHAIDRDGQVQGIHHSIRDALIERGLLQLDADGVWRFTGDVPDLAAARYRFLAICDFCSARPAPWTIPCVTFQLPSSGPGMPEEISEGDWMACDTCGEYIAATRREALLAQALKEHAGEPRPMRRIRKRMVMALHARFWRHYKGGATRGPVSPFGH